MPDTFPILDDHMHINPRKGLGMTAIQQFKRSGGTHIVLVSLASWSYGINLTKPDDFRDIFTEHLKIVDDVRSEGCVCYPICGVHPCELERLLDRMSLNDAETLLCGALDIAAEFVDNNLSIGIKSGRPHYAVNQDIWDTSNRILLHALTLASDHDCCIQIHAEESPCTDIVDMAKQVGMDINRVVKHFATCDTPLHPSVTVREPILNTWISEKKDFTLESDYIDDMSRPGAANGPRSVPRHVNRMLNANIISTEDIWRINSKIPERVYRVPFEL